MWKTLDKNTFTLKSEHHACFNAIDLASYVGINHSDIQETAWKTIRIGKVCVHISNSLP